MADDAVSLNSQDGDLGSGGPVALPASMGTTDDPDPMVEDGKQGILYVLNMQDLGGYQQGAGDTDDVEYETPQSDGGVWGKASVWPGDGGYLYNLTSGTTPVTANGGALNVFQRVDTGGALSFQLVGSTANSDNTFGYGSGSPIVTSDGTTSGTALLWIIHATGPNGVDSQARSLRSGARQSRVGRDPRAGMELITVHLDGVLPAERRQWHPLRGHEGRHVARLWRASLGHTCARREQSVV